MGEAEKPQRPGLERRAALVAKGLCPSCGKDAIPYYLCSSCRFSAKLRRVLKSGLKSGALASEGEGRNSLWRLGDKNADWTYREAKEGDKRKRPRLRGIPVDVEKTIIQILVDCGKPMLVEDIVSAWGRLRVRPGRASLAHDVVQILSADEKRKRKLEKRALAAHAPA